MKPGAKLCSHCSTDVIPSAITCTIVALCPWCVRLLQFYLKFTAVIRRIALFEALSQPSVSTNNDLKTGMPTSMM